MKVKNAGRQVIQETVRLLDDIRFGPRKGAYVKGRHVAVHVDCRSAAAGNTITAAVTCLGLGPCTVNWRGLPLIVTSLGAGQDYTSLVFLDSRGQTIVPELPPSECSIAAFDRTSPKSQCLAEPDFFNALAETGDLRTTDRTLDKPFHVVSELHDVAAVVQHTEQGIQLNFTATRPGLAGSVVRFALVDMDGRTVRTRGVCALRPPKPRESGGAGKSERSPHPSPPPRKRVSEARRSLFDYSHPLWQGSLAGQESFATKELDASLMAVVTGRSSTDADTPSGPLCQGQETVPHPGSRFHLLFSLVEDAPSD